jgi:23S rRNA pseudouridine1911/1915/1917 synthase
MGDTDGLPSVIYEDRDLVAVRKPVRMHSAPGQGSGDLCAWVFERYPDATLAGAGANGAAGRLRPALEGGLLHRLDYETSGIVLFARSAEAFGSLLRQQEEGGFYKEYLALSTVSAENLPLGSLPRRGVPAGLDGAAWGEGRDRLDPGALAALLDAAVSRGGAGIACSFRPYGPKGSRVACLLPSAAEAGKGAAADPAQAAAQGAAAKQGYRSDILSCSRDGRATEIRVGLSRGFRHQVRAQLAWVGLPISGDLLYGGRPDERLRLHAVGLSFTHPGTGEAMRLKADP